MADRTQYGRAPTWKQGSVTSWLTTLDHKRIGILYIVTAFFFFFAGGIMAFLMRLQLAQPDEHFIQRNAYNELFTIHGTTMIFLFVVPILAGFGNYLVPLMIGAHDMAFPRLNALSYWLFLLGGLVILGSFGASGGAANSGWTAYTPLSGPDYSPAIGQDLWILGLHLTSLGSLAGAINFIVTIHNMRTRGMTWMRIPLFVWSIEAYSVLLVLALPTISAAVTLLLLDRQTGTHFFEPATGGSQLLWQHMFWFFGHPEVYIIFIPATGMVSAIIVAFTRRPIFGYTAMVLSLVSTAFIGFGLWVHHMFATGLPQLGESFFTAASMMIAIPSGIQVFCWLATLWQGRPQFKTPLLFACGFIAVFVF
ncbi:MAG TPA: cbb3-type cytochrome c oxidase subunit I, partial [Gaiellaceae bacterium]